MVIKGEFLREIVIKIPSLCGWEILRLAGNTEYLL